MAVIQPLYFAGGRYSANVDRKLLAALMQSASDGTRIEGVIPANQGTNSLKVSTSSGMTLSVSSGLCLIADAATQDVDTPGVYLAGVDTSAETVVIADNSTGSTRYDLVYADVSENYYSITKKQYSSTTNTATITTSSAHGYIAGQTVYVSGIDEFYDGAYIVATVPTSTTFTYTKSGGTTEAETNVLPTVQLGSTIATITNKALTATSAGASGNIATITTSAAHGLTTASNLNDLITIKGIDGTFDGSYHLLTASGSTITYKINRNPLAAVSSTAVTSSAAAKARVPFAIKVYTGTTTTEPSLPSGTNIKLAVVTVANGATAITSANIADRRQFVTSIGGVYLFDSSISAITQPTLPEGSLSYDLSSNSLQYYTTAATAGSGSTVSALTLSGTGSATTAAKSDHTHTEYTDYLGISQVRQANAGPTATTLPIFPSASDTTTLSASTTYKMQAIIYARFDPSSTTQQLSFDLQPSVNFSGATFDFITWDQVEASTINYSGQNNEVDGDFFVSTTLAAAGSKSVVINIDGFLITSASSTTVTPRIYLTSGNLYVYTGSYIAFYGLGNSSVTTIRGTWA